MHDTQSLENVIADGIQHFVVNILSLIGIGVVMISINWQLTVLTLIPVPIVIVVSRFLWKHLRGLWHRYMYYRARLSASVNDVLSGIRVVKAFGKEEDEIIRFCKDSAELQSSDQRAEQTWATWFPCLWFITSTGSLLVWYFGGQQVITQRVTLGILMTFQSYLAMFYGPLQFLSRIADYLARSLTSAERVFEILDSERDIQPEEDIVPLPSMRGRVELKNVTFSYEAGRPALKNISFTVNEGEMVGLVGHTGAGKTTTVNLICGFYEPQQGEVLIDGIKVRKIRRSDLRKQVGVVLQDTFLFNGTIAENIAYAKPDADELEIIRAAKAANAHDFIVHKPDGYDTKVGERGQALSAGERQRIAIARAILHNPRILILDEATAAVDVETEQHIQEAINRLVEGRTTLAIAHRIGTLSHANTLLVFKEGEIVEAGPPLELIARKGELYRLLNISTGNIGNVEQMFTRNKRQPEQDESISSVDFLRILQPQKLHFIRDGALLRVIVEDEFSVDNAVILRAFPLSNASRYFSIYEREGKEIGILRDMDGLSPEDRQILLDELGKRYFVPKILRILSTNERFGTVEWTVETDRGVHKFTTRELRENVLRLGRGRYILIDVDENRYEIPDTSMLDPSSYSRLIRHL
jgi:ATP-binding cassette subfamily B protein